MSLVDWKVLYVKPRCEKKMAAFCASYGIPYYLPTSVKTRIVQRRKVNVDLPLFPGYVFAEFPMDSRLKLLQTNLLVRILVPERPFLLARQLVMVRKALHADPMLTAEPPLEKGMNVRVIDGPMMGIIGTIERLASKLRVVVNIEMIGQAVAMTVDRNQVMVLSD
ncbi:MAG: hypothetical protein J6Z49_02780 [Kiritimatiellae bacterium]|nr:hypothetical protein [Kiritimatiellia bacterium]